jgi:hypothetical protein
MELGEDLLQHERVHVHHAILQQMQNFIPQNAEVGLAALVLVRAQDQALGAGAHHTGWRCRTVLPERTL